MCSRILGAVALAAAVCAAIVSTGCVSDGYDVAIVPVNDEMRARYVREDGAYDLAALRSAGLAGEIPDEHDFGTLEMGSVAAAAGAWTEHDVVNLTSAPLEVMILNQMRPALHSDPDRPTSPLWLVSRGPFVNGVPQWHYSADWLSLQRGTTSWGSGNVHPSPGDNSTLALELRDCPVLWERTEFSAQSWSSRGLLDRVGFDLPPGARCRLRWRFHSHEAEASWRVALAVLSEGSPFPSVHEIALRGAASDPDCAAAPCVRATQNLLQAAAVSETVHSFPVRTLDFGPVGTERAAHRLVWFENMGESAVRIAGVSLFDLETLASFEDDAPARFELVATTGDSVVRCEAGTALAPGDSCFVQAWFSGADSATPPLAHGLLLVSYMEEGSSVLEQHPLWLVAQTAPVGEAIVDTDIDVPHLGSTRMNVARPMFARTGSPGETFTLYSDRPDNGTPFRLACRERVPAMECWKFPVTLDGYSRGWVVSRGQVLWAFQTGDPLKFTGLDMDSGFRREYELPMDWVSAQLAASYCMESAGAPAVRSDTLRWIPEEAASDPFAGAFSLDFNISGYTCVARSYRTVVFTVTIGFQPDGTPVALGVEQIP